MSQTLIMHVYIGYDYSAKKNFFSMNMNIVEINHDLNSESFHVYSHCGFLFIT